MNSNHDTRGLQGRISRIEELLRAVNEIADPDTRARARELVRVLLDLHRAGIERMLDLVHKSKASGQTLIDALAEDEMVSNLLLLHDLHPDDLETRVRCALETVRPRLGLHGGSVELVSVSDEGAVTLRLEGNCHGCPSSRITLHSTIEEALYKAAPDITALEVEGTQVQPAMAGAPKFTECRSQNGNGDKPQNGDHL